TRTGPNRVGYKVSYWKWTRIAATHGALLGLVFLACYVFLPGMRREVHGHTYGPTLFWGQISFWCLLWPWLLSAFHRGPAERALQRILRETLSGPEAANRTAA